MYECSEITSVTAGTALEANRLVTYAGAYCTTASLRYKGVTLKDGASGDAVPVGIPGVGLWPVYVSEAADKGDILEFDDDGKLKKYSSGKAVGQIYETLGAAGIAPVLLYGPQAPALTT